MTVRFEDELAWHGRLVYTTTGTSMLPMLRQKRDLVVVERPHGRLKKYDVALFRDGEGKYILHRVLEAGPEGYVFRGDHNRGCERGIREEQIVGVLTAFVRDGREIAVTNAAYRAYAALWCGSYRFRMGARRCRSFLERLRGKWRERRDHGESRREDL